MRIRCRLLGPLVLASLIAAPPGARAESLVLPGVARANGVGGARFVSTAWLHNPSDDDLAVSLGLVTAWGAAAPLSLTLAPRETRRIEDPLALFGLESGAGTLTASAARPFALRGTTANVADPRGTYGLALLSSRAEEGLHPGETGAAVGLSHTAANGVRFRTNVAVTLLSNESEVLVTLLDDTGLVRAEERIASQTPFFWQRSVGELSPDAEIPLGSLEVHVVRGAAAAYLAIVDNVTGDGVLVPARRRDALSAPLLLPGAARSPGANGTLWRTALTLANPTLVPSEVTLSPVGLAGVSEKRSVPPRGLLEIPDLLALLGAPEGSAGGVRLVSAPPLELLAVTRNADPAGRPGTFAASQEAVAADALAGAGRVLAFTGLSADSGATGFRTNVAFVAGEGGAGAHLVLRATSGAILAEADAALAAGSWTQRSLAAWFGASTVPRDATLEVRVLSGTLAAYASVIDNGTGDPVVLAPADLPGTSCPPAGTSAVLTASASEIAAGSAVTLRLEAPGRAAGTLVPGGISLAPGASVTVTPALTTTYRWLSPTCPADAPLPVTVQVNAPAGSVMTDAGAVRGVAASGALAYRGIPFAAPPTGPLRFRPPAPPSPSAGVRDTVTFGPICPQLDDGGRVLGNEGCLTLNVFTPASAPAGPLPVLFFIHGGGNVQGSSSQPVYDGSAWAKKERAVVVTANYRLGTLGWLAQPFLAAESRRGVSGNTGTLDQLAALRWVRRDIAAFGGDPDRVAIFGESAGGVNVCALVASPLAKGLFARALVESGSCIRRPYEDFVAFGVTVTSAAGCGASADPAACLRALSFEDLLLAMPPIVSVSASSSQLWGPSVDGFVLRDSPDTALASGTHNRVSFAIGANADETARDAAVVTTEALYRTLVAAQYGVLAPLILARYPVAAYGSPQKAYAAVTGDARFVCPSRRSARAAVAGGSAKVFRYFFSYPANPFFGAVHAVELPFVFGTLTSVPGYTPGAADLALSESMNAAWARFAATGDPNGPGLPLWPLYDPAADSTLVWDAPPFAANGIRTERCDFWDALTSSL